MSFMKNILSCYKFSAYPIVLIKFVTIINQKFNLQDRFSFKDIMAPESCFKLNSF